MGAEVGRNHSAENDRRTDKRDFGEKNNNLGKNAMNLTWRELYLPANFTASLRYRFSSPQNLSIFRKASKDGVQRKP